MKSAILVLFATAVLVSTVPISNAVAQSKWDGEWVISIEYSRSSSSSPACAGHLFPDPMTVSNGRITGVLRHEQRGAVFLSGSVTEDGRFSAKGVADAVEGVARGNLTEKGGNGTWEETKRTYCDGTWTAVRK